LSHITGSSRPLKIKEGTPEKATFPAKQEAKFNDNSDCAKIEKELFSLYPRNIIFDNTAPSYSISKFAKYYQGVSF
jgi:hypothetical protein